MDVFFDDRLPCGNSPDEGDSLVNRGSIGVGIKDGRFLPDHASPVGVASSNEDASVVEIFEDVGVGVVAILTFVLIGFTTLKTPSSIVGATLARDATPSGFCVALWIGFSTITSV